MNLGQRVLKLSGIEKFNPMQELVLKRDWQNKSLVVSSPTASGKTLIAELLALNSIVSKRKKVVYTCPLKALASEHYSEFKKKYSSSLRVRFALSTGDLDSSSRHLHNYDLIFTTYEKLDSLIRHRADWLQEVGLLIIDEVHEIDSGRGATLEITACKLRQLNPEMQVLALSATIPNSKELSEWLGAELVESDYRPIPLREGVYFNKEMLFADGGKPEAVDGENPLEAVVNDTISVRGKQAMVFANTRRNAEGMAKRLSSLAEKSLGKKEKALLKGDAEKILSALESPTEQCRKLASLIEKGAAFHHAGLMMKQRGIVEEAFKENRLKVIAATPTLAAGVNLPSHTVILPSLYRFEAFGMTRIPVREYKQMCLPFNAKLLTKEAGFLEIGKIVEGKIECSALSLNMGTLKAEFKPITKFFKRESDELMKLNLSTGNELRLTPNHEVLVRENGAFIWKKASDLETGDLLVHQKLSPVRQLNSPIFFELLPNNGTYVVGCGKLFLQVIKKLNITEKELAKKLSINRKNIYHIKKNKKAMRLDIFLTLTDLLGFSIERKARLARKIKTAHGTPITLPFKVTPDFMWLVGFIATDGNINYTTDKRTGSKYGTVRVFNKNKRLIAKSEKIFKSLGLKPCRSIRPDGLITLEVGATLLAKILRTHFGIEFGNKTISVRIPQFLLTSNQKLIGGYLGGVFDGDGNYNKSKQKRGIASNVYRILFAASSKDFAFGIQSLLLRLGIVASVKEEDKVLITAIRGKKVVFDKPAYPVIFRKIEYIKKFSKYAKFYKCQINVEYSKYHNVDKRDYSSQEFELVKVTAKKQIKSNKLVYNVQVKDNENYFASNVLVHNCGRAGRPKYDSEGRGISIANGEIDADDIMEHYLKGEIEEITSQLGIEPVLRMHLLSLVATHFVFDLHSMEEFFEKTFYAKQYGDLAELFSKVKSALEQLEEWEFIESDEKRILATPLGKRVSELYLDPMTAHAMVETMSSKKKFSDLSWLFLFAQSSEFMPWLSVSKKKEPELWEQLQLNSSQLPIDIEKEMYFDLNLLRKFNSAVLLEDWVSEKSEQDLLKEFNTQPGILHSKLFVCDWLAYSALEIAKLLSFQGHFSAISKMRRRLKYGVKEELVGLCEVKFIGRVRARRLWRAKIKSVAELKRTDQRDLARVLGEGVAAKIRAQIGQRKPNS